MQPKKEIFWAQKTANLLAKGRGKIFFWRRKMKKAGEIEMIATINSFLLFSNDEGTNERVFHFYFAPTTKRIQTHIQHKLFNFYLLRHTL